MKLLNHPFCHLIRGTEAVLPLMWSLLDPFCFSVLQLFLILFRPAPLASWYSLCPAFNKKARFFSKIGMYFSLPLSAMGLFILIRIKAHVLPELVRRDQAGLRVMRFHLNCNQRSVFEIKRFNNILYTGLHQDK